MPREFDLLPTFSVTWEQLHEHGVVRPHPTATKDELWMWINEHENLMSESIRLQRIAMSKDFFIKKRKKS